LIRGEVELIRGELEEAGSLAVVLGQPATTASIERPEIGLAIGPSLVSGELKEAGSLAVVLRETATTILLIGGNDQKRKAPSHP
jgi:hypothetical protein